MYTHLVPVINSKPDVILLHVGTNDCATKTSDEVLGEIIKLEEHLRVVCPQSLLILSLPTIRTDFNRANVIIKNLNVKIKNLGYMHMDNENINELDLGKKGLHFNKHGTKKMASNIISLIKRL